MTVRQAIFLSASVPTTREPEYLTSADTVAIAAAVAALVYVVLGRRPLVWGGHPAITPMVWAVAEELRVDYGNWVRLYQSRFFEDDFPEDNARFDNVTYTAPVLDSRDLSLLSMREQMFRDHEFSAAVFIGGMSGVVKEFELFRVAQPKASLVPVASTGGASLSVARLIAAEADVFDDLDYVPLFHAKLGIPVEERRRNRPGSTSGLE
jgi:SLOG cluster3 family